MPILTDLRLIDLNFDFDKAHIQDLLIKVKGKESLWLIKNGGGKSVMSQMIMQPYVFGHNRDYSERKFRGYLPYHKPFYEVHQYELDDNAGFVVVCFMALRAPNEDNDTEQVNITTVIGQFPVKVDIENIPFFYKDNNGKTRLNGYDNMVDYFNNTPKYEGFHLGRTKEETEGYIKTLYRYKIDVKEWSEIIRVANLDESGLSKFFENYYKSSDIARRLFLPKIEAKLSAQGINLEEYSETIYNYFKNIENNKENLRNEKIYNQFLALSEVAENDIKAYIEDIEKLNQSHSLLGQYHAYVKQCMEERNVNLQKLFSDLDNADKYMKKLEYEKASIDYHNFMDECSRLKEMESKLDDNISSIENENKKITFNLDCLECARLYMQLKKNEPKLENLKARKEKLLQGEDLGKINRYKYTLQCKFEEVIAQKKKAKDDLEQNRITEKNNETVLINQKNREDKEHKTFEIKLASIEQNISDFEKKIQVLSKFYEDFIPLKTFLGYDENYFKEYMSKLEREDKKISSQLEDIIKEKDKIFKNISEGHLKINEISSKISELNQELKDLKREKTAYITAKNKLIDILNNYNIELSELFNKEHVLSKLTYEEATLDKNYRVLSEKSIELGKEIEKLKKCEVFSVPAQFKEQLEERGIEYQTGFEYLKNNPNFSLERKQQFLEDNKFIPYSLLVDEEEAMNKILEIDEYVSFPIPLMEKRTIFKSIDTYKDIKFFTGFNADLLDEDKLQSKIKNLESTWETIEGEIGSIKSGMDSIREYKTIVENFNYSSIFEDKVNNDIALTSKNIADLENAKTSLNEIIRQMTEKNEHLEKQYRETYNVHTDLKNKITKIEEVNGKLPVYYEELKQRDILKKEIKNKVALIEEISSELIECRERINKLNEAIPEASVEISKYEKMAEQFKDVEEMELIDTEKDIGIIYEIYEALTKEYGDTLSNLNNEIAELETSVNEDRDALNSMKSNKKVKNSDFELLKYSTDKKLELDGLIRKNNKVIKELNEKKTNVRGEIGGVNTKINGIKNHIQSIYYCEPEDKGNLAIDKNYEKEILEVKSAKQKISDEINSEDSRIKILNTEIAITSQYDLTFNASLLNPLELSIEEMEVYRTKLMNSLNRIIKQVSQNKEDLFDVKLKDFMDVFKGQNKVFEEALAEFSNKSITPEELLNKLGTIRDVIEHLLERIRTALTSIKEDENLIIEHLFEFIKRLYSELGEIDRGSTINTKDGTRRKMLKIRMKYDISYLTKELVKMQVLDEIIRESELEKEAEKDVLEYIKNFIKAANLFDRTFGMDSIDVNLYKITERGISHQSFEEAKTNSGGEGSFTTFIILSCVMSYFRRNGINSDAGWKVMILDNPFAKMTSPHLLIPLFDLAKKLQVQLICLSDIDTESVKDRFEDIHVFMHVPVKGLDKETLLIEMTDEPKRSLSDNQFNFGYEEVTQTSLI